MCGIAGIYHFKNEKRVDERAVVKMRDTLAHRGPDGAGLYVSPDGKVGLGHRRLKIIDLSDAAAQPLANEDGSVQVIYNGEIYNFKELRAELEKKGHKFVSHGDTEIIVHAYEEYGADCVKRFNGMFAFALWDDKRKTFFAARDHVGVKPFYYAVQDGTLYFGSEIKALLAHPAFRKRFAKKHVSYYLTFASLPAPYTLFEDVYKLPAASTLFVREGKEPLVESYWNPLSAARRPSARTSENEYAEEVRSILTDSIEKQMVSDVPFGCFLSGGIDSSANAFLMSKALGEPVETFSIAAKGYGEKYDELKYARQVGEMLGAKQHERYVEYGDLTGFLPEYAKHFDDPNGDPITFLVYYLSKLIRESGVIVAQVGEGSDELFTGYDATVKALRLHERLWRFAEHIPQTMRRVPYALLRASGNDFAAEYARRLASGEEPYWGHAIAFTPTQKEALLTSEYRDALAVGHEYEIVKSLYKEVREDTEGADFLTYMTYVDLKLRLPEFLLQRVDRMAMAHSVETRVPFLDTRLVELALAMPQSVKLGEGETKHVLKQALRGIVPDNIMHRPKQGFGAPLSEWLRHDEMLAPLRRVLDESPFKAEHVINGDYVEELFKAHRAGKADHSFRIWNLITLSLWYARWIAE